jgi:hypothetical protein
MQSGYFIRSVESALAKIIGCRFPYAPFQTTTGKELTYDKIKSDYIVINFNYLYCDRCINQLDSLVKIKKSSTKTITIVSFFACDKNDIKHLTDKFKDDVLFVSHLLGLGIRLKQATTSVVYDHYELHSRHKATFISDCGPNDISQNQYLGNKMNMRTHRARC